MVVLDLVIQPSCMGDMQRTAFPPLDMSKTVAVIDVLLTRHQLRVWCSACFFHRFLARTSYVSIFCWHGQGYKKPLSVESSIVIDSQVQRQWHAA